MNSIKKHLALICLNIFISSWVVSVVTKVIAFQSTIVVLSILLQIFGLLLVLYNAQNARKALQSYLKSIKNFTAKLDSLRDPLAMVEQASTQKKFRRLREDCECRRQEIFNALESFYQTINPEQIVVGVSSTILGLILPLTLLLSASQQTRFINYVVEYQFILGAAPMSSVGIYITLSFAYRILNRPKAQRSRWTPTAMLFMMYSHFFACILAVGGLYVSYGVFLSVLSLAYVETFWSVVM